MSKKDFKNIQETQINLLFYWSLPKHIRYRLYRNQENNNYHRIKINNAIKYQSSYNHCTNPNCDYHDLELCNDQLFCPYCGCNTSSYDKMFF